MLTLSPGSACDVCAEEYGQQRMPHSMSCGHVLCASCCTNIVEKTSPRLSPACPFCREPFTRESLRIIRMDFTTSGWSTPHRIPAISTASEFNKVLFDQTTGSLLNFTNSKAGLGVRRLEERVARVAAKKCSVEEVSALYKELEEWIIAEKDEQTSSLVLSAALLRAILMNHLAHSEASKSSKTAESNLKTKIDELENANAKFESELRRYALPSILGAEKISDPSLFDSVIQLIRQRAQYTQKSQECQQLRQEVSQLRALATTLGISAPEAPQRSMSPTPSAPSPTPYSSSASSSASAAAAAASPLSRFSSSHSHSRSLSMSSRPTTPAMPTSPTRSHTPAPPRSHTPANVPPRSHTPGPNSSSAYYPSRSHTPGPGSMSASTSASSVASSRSQTPAPPSASASAYARSQTPSIRSYTPAPSSTPVPPVPRYSTPAPPSMSLRAQTPAPLVPPKPRRLSQTTPPQMYRSTSEEKADAHERWIPPASPQGEYDYNKYKSSTPRPPSRSGHSLASRLRDVLS